MSYPYGTPSSGVTNPYTGSFTPLEPVASIKDNQTSIDKASLARSLGTQIALIQNFVNSTYLGRKDIPVQNGYITNISGVNGYIANISGVNSEYNSIVASNISGINNNLHVLYGSGYSDYNAMFGTTAYISHIDLSGLYVQKSVSSYFSRATLDSAYLTLSGSTGLLTLGRNGLVSNQNFTLNGSAVDVTSSTDINIIAGNSVNLFSTGALSSVNVLASGTGSYTTIGTLTPGASANIVSQGDINIWNTTGSGYNLSLQNKSTDGIIELISSGNTYITAGQYPSSYKNIYITASSVNISGGSNLHIDGGIISFNATVLYKMYNLPTSEPGQSQALWNSGGYLCIS
jgi:hypothetical protein